MSSCLMPAPLPVPVLTSSARRSLKRPLAATEDAMSLDRILKAHKRSTVDSPRAMAALVKPVVKQYGASWPQIQTAETVQNAIAFLRDSRQHALVLLTQNQWQRALSVLDKVERANDIVARQRRKVVLEQSNAANAFLQCLDNDIPKPARKVRFHDEVQVATAVDADRSPAKVPGFVKEEILILRASRPIPKENYSEFWN